MTATQKAPECEQGMHQFCTGPGAIQREGAPAWEAPLMTLRCDCPCHGQIPRIPRVGRSLP
ncbi:hypothetical protein ACKI16_24125 [Streptomyces scabiei]|uniref:hypothetical protein n=1 Tax=Streptomyces scabiei TaxID=1930 RepID=UPI0038F71689